MKKIVIIYEKFGAGHLRMANILESILQGPDVEIQKFEACELFLIPSMKKISEVWNFLTKKNLTWLANVLVVFGARLLPSPILEVATTKKIHQKIAELKPDIIISTIICYNKPLGSYAKKNGIPFYIMITDIMPSFTDMVNPNAKHLCYFQESKNFINSFNFNNIYFTCNIYDSTNIFQKIKYLSGYLKNLLFKGLDAIYHDLEKTYPKMNNVESHITGPLAEKKHFERKDKNKIRQKLNISNQTTITIASGSIGGSLLKKIVKVICQNYTKSINLIVICGKDKKSLKWLNKFKDKQGKINIKPFGYVDNFDEILTISNCIICRASAGVFIEALLNNTPILMPQNVTANDKGCQVMLKKYQLGEIYTNHNSLIDKLEKIVINNNDYKNNIKKLINAYPGSYEEKEQQIKKIILG